MGRSPHDWFRIWVLVLLVSGVGGYLAAQDESPEYYGTASTNYHFVASEEFQAFEPDNSVWRDAFTSGGRYILGSATGLVAANVRLPTGALITGMWVLYEDSDADDGLEVQLIRTWWGIGSRGSEIIGAFFSSGTPGITRSFIDIDPDHTVAYWASPISHQAYRLVAFMDPSPSVQLRGVIISWKRQISPEPAVATFADVPVGAFGFRHIEALADSGITAGCGGGNFCPNNTLTRAEMAVFLAKALGLHWSP